MRYHMNARIHRSIRHNLSFYVLSSILTAIVVFLIVIVFSGIGTMQHDFHQIQSDGNVEEAQFTTVIPITDEEMEKMEEKYQIQLERMEFVDITESGRTFRIYKDTSKINRHQLLDGREMESTTEILLNRDYILQNELSIQDSIRILNKEYQICGIAVRPDYLYAQKELSDFYLNKKLFGIVIMDDDAFEQLEHTQMYYSVIYESENQVEVRDDINHTYRSMSYLSAAANNRINLPIEHLKQTKIIFGAMVPIFFLLVVALVAVVLGRMIKREKKQIGTMVAFGYRKHEIVKHYIRFAAIPGVIGSIIGVLLSVPLLHQAILLFSADFETINYHVAFDIPMLMLGLIMPTILNVITGMLIVRRLLRKNVIVLLAGNCASERQNNRKLFAKSKLPFQYKYWIRTLLQNKSRTLVTLFGMIAGAFMCFLSFMLIDSCDYMIDQGVDAAGSYEYQYVLNTLQTEVPDGGEPMLAMNYEVKGKRIGFSLNGVVEQPKYLNLATQSNEPIQYGKYYLTSNAAILYHVSPGDTFVMQNPLTLKETKVEITDIIQDDIQCALYSSRDNVAEILGIPSESYNVLMSAEPLDVNLDHVYRSINKQDLREQLKYTIDMMYEMIRLLIGFGVILCIIAVYLTVNMLLQENVTNISMLKVLGYKTKEINRLVIHTNHILVPIAVGLSLMACTFLCDQIFKKFIDLLNIYIHPEIKITSVLICIGILVVTYAVSILLLKRKVLRVHMVESLKDNRE